MEMNNFPFCNRFRNCYPMLALFILGIVTLAYTVFPLSAAECPWPENIENGYIYYRYRETVTYRCNPTYVLDGPVESRCEKTGQWSTKPTCRAPCTIPVERATVLYNDRKVKVQDHLKSGIQHAEIIEFFCKNKARGCSFTSPAQCVDGNFKVPACFEEHGMIATFIKTDIANLPPCENVN